MDAKSTLSRRAIARGIALVAFAAGLALSSHSPMFVTSQVFAQETSGVSQATRESYESALEEIAALEEIQRQYLAKGQTSLALDQVMPIGILAQQAVIPLYSERAIAERDGDTAKLAELDKMIAVITGKIPEASARMGAPTSRDEERAQTERIIRENPTIAKPMRDLQSAADEIERLEKEYRAALTKGEYDRAKQIGEEMKRVTTGAQKSSEKLFYGDAGRPTSEQRAERARERRKALYGDPDSPAGKLWSTFNDLLVAAARGDEARRLALRSQLEAALGADGSAAAAFSQGAGQPAVIPTPGSLTQSSQISTIDDYLKRSDCEASSTPFIPAVGSFGLGQDLDVVDIAVRTSRFTLERRNPDPTAALETLEGLIKAAEATGFDAFPDATVFYRAKADLLQRANRFEEARALWDTLRKRDSVLPFGSSRSGDVFALVGCDNFPQVQASLESEAHLRVLFRAAARIAGTDRTDTRALSEPRLAGSLDERKIRRQSPYFRLPLLGERVRLSLLANGPTAPETLEPLTVYGDTLYALGLYLRAVIVYERAYQIASKGGDEGTRSALDLLVKYSSVLLELGESDKAFSVIDASLARARQELPAEDPTLLALLGSYSQALIATQRRDEAYTVLKSLIGPSRRTIVLAPEHRMRILSSYTLLQDEANAREGLYSREKLQAALGSGDVAAMMRRLNPQFENARQINEITSAWGALLSDRDRIVPPSFYEGMYEPFLRMIERDTSSDLLATARGQLADIETKAGKDHPVSLRTATMVAGALARRGLVDEARERLSSTLSTQERQLGAAHPDTSATRIALANTYRASGSKGASGVLDLAGDMTRLIRQRRKTLATSVRSETQSLRNRRAEAEAFIAYSDIAWLAAQEQGRAPGNTATEAALIALQDANTTSAGLALAQLSARALAEEAGQLGSLARQRQELAEAWQDAEARVTLAQAIREADGEAIRQEARQQLVSLEEEIALLDQRLRDEVPEFFDLINPSSLDAKAVQRLLSNGEAALLIMPGEFGTHSIAVTPDAIQWHRSELTELEVNRLVARLRASVATSGSPKRFHRKDAYQLYTELVEPLQGILASSQEVYAVPGGSLAALPLAVLVTQEPKGPDVDPQALRETAWLSDRFALVQLPSLQSLLFLRRFNSGDTNYRTDASFAGFGDPDLDGRASSRGGGDTALLRTAYLPNAGGEAAIADVSQLRRLASLPGTQAELIAIQSALGAPVQSVVLGEEATETTVRKTDLSRINVLAFATHGLLAGEVDGIAEPALVFTPPDAPNARDDGLLTASEITTLKLNADWVILSACNTAAGEGGGEGLSGLARAFFYAGARSLLASHWPVRDDIAPNLIVTMILEQQRDPDLSRARALQRAIVEIRSNIADPSSAHPAAWAPFVIVGEGR